MRDCAAGDWIVQEGRRKPLVPFPVIRVRSWVLVVACRLRMKLTLSVDGIPRAGVRTTKHHERTRTTPLALMKRERID